jgi:uncharacterized membrane protein
VSVPDEPKPRRSILQLSRLETLTDVVYALVLFRIFLLIPAPDHTGWHWGYFLEFFGDNAITLVLVVIGLAVTIIYWGQSNMLLGSLQKTDGRHTALAIVQIFCLLLFIKALRIGVDLGGSPGTRALESAAAALAGIMAAWGWSYAIKNRRLLHDDISDDAALETRDRILAEPITALVTIPLAFVGPWLWEAAWLTYPLFIKLLKRRRTAKVMNQ